jgi:hypothetical protein
MKKLIGLAEELSKKLAAKMDDHIYNWVVDNNQIPYGWVQFYEFDLSSEGKAGVNIAICKDEYTLQVALKTVENQKGVQAFKFDEDMTMEQFKKLYEENKNK